MEILLTYLAKSAGLLIVFFALYYFLLRQDHSFSTNRRFLLGGLFASAVLPSVQFTKTVFVEAQTSQFQMIEGDFPVSEVFVQEPVITPMEILLIIYLTGVAFMTGRMLLQLFSLLKILYSGKAIKSGGINYVSVAGKMAPFSFLNFIVYNPALHSETELLHILKHEKVHVNQWHTADVLLANLNLIYQWFNPFAWLYVNVLQQNLEYIADSEAVKEVSCKKEYQKSLVKISVENFNPVLTNSFYQSFIKKRIVMLNRKSTSKNNYWKVTLALPFMVAFIFLFNIKTEAQIKPAQEKTEENFSGGLKISGTITKNSTEESLESLKKVFARQGVTLDYENIERSPDGIITAISVGFLNKNTNSSGLTNQHNPEGINPFEVFFENDTTGFATISEDEEKGKSAKDVVTQAGKNALFIVNGVEYTSSDLAGKSIEIKGGFVFLDHENSTKYGDKGKDGVIMISKGKIIDDIDEEMKNIDSENIPVKKSYIQIRKGEKPMFIEVDKNNGSISNIQNSGEREISSDTVKNPMSVKGIQGNPVYIINGKEVSGATVQGMNPENVSNISVLKGASAVSVYGKKAEDGAVIIETKKDTVNKTMAFSVRSGNSKSTGMAATSGTGMQDSIGKKFSPLFVSRISYDKTNTYTINSDSTDINASQWSTRSSPAKTMVYLGNKKPLYVVDGKEMSKDFDMESLNPQNISSINVLKDEASVKKYGEKAADGVIEVTTKNSENDLTETPASFAILKANTTDEGLRIMKSQLEEQAGLDVNFSDIKRNREGLIKAIKVIGKKGNQEISGTYNETGQIPDIYIGVQNGNIMVTSTPPKK